MQIKPIYVLLLAVAVVLIGAGVYYLQNQKEAGANTQTPPAPPTMTEQQKKAAQLLLAALDKDIELEQPYMRYYDEENGVKTEYVVIKNQEGAYVKEESEWGKFEVYRTANNTTVVCATYLNETRCTDKTNEEIEAAAAGLLARIPTKDDARENKRLTEKLIDYGAIKFAGEIEEEKIGQFETWKIKYELDYRNLTVQTLLSLGISPQDPQVTQVSDWKVERWVDKRTGRLVKSKASYKIGLARYQFMRMYEEVEPQTNKKFELPSQNVEGDEFLLFIKRAQEDYEGKMKCLSLAGQEKWACIKGLAKEKKDSKICNMIEEKSEQEKCVLVVAEVEPDPTICEGLAALKDDCYIVVVGQTGNRTLCEKLANKSLGEACLKAAVEGERREAERRAELEKRAMMRNCQRDEDCYVAGNQGQYCVPTTNKGPFENESSPFLSCFKNLSCGCIEGYCSFRKNKEYYSCIDKVEEELLKEMIRELSKKAKNQTND